MSYLRTLKRHTSTLLAGLGDSPDEVAESLRAAGVTGVPRDNRSCAVAVYVSALMGSEPRIRSVAVGHCALSISLLTPDRRPAGRLMVQLPKPVRRFVADFDDERYPSVTARPDRGPGPGNPPGGTPPERSGRTLAWATVEGSRGDGEGEAPGS